MTEKDRILQDCAESLQRFCTGIPPSRHTTMLMIHRTDYKVYGGVEDQRMKLWGHTWSMHTLSRENELMDNGMRFPENK